MTPLENFSAALYVAFGLILLWFLVFRLFRHYRIDSLRDRLFAIREKLFDYAADGSISFDHPAYTKLRMLINSLIRFAHRLTFTRFAMGAAFMAWRDEPYGREPLVEWYKALETLPTESQDELRRIHGEALVLVVRHLVSGSPVMLALLTVFSIWAVLNGLAKRLLEAFTDKLPGLELLQAQAIEADTAERRSEKVFAY